VHAALVCLVTLGTGCDRGPQRYDEAFVAMGAAAEITVLSDSEPGARAALAAARREIERLDSLLSDYRPTSNVGRLNDRRTRALAPETAKLLARAQEVCRETGGAFDVSLGPVKRLWGFGENATPHVPDSLALRGLLAHVGCEVYALQPDGTLEWRDDQARIDLGGIAQGFAAACVAETLRARGIVDFLVNLSGDIVVGGERAGGGRWRIGVQHPRRPDTLLVTLPTRWRAVTTAGDYEQSFIENGVRYHHIFDPTTGAPARGTVSVSVFADDPVAADCYDTALFVLGVERGLAFLAAHPHVQALFVTETASGELERYSTAGLDSLLAPHAGPVR